MSTPTRTNWHVITGGPCTGKTTMANKLTERGYKTTIEHARHYIDTHRVLGESVEEIKRHKYIFQRGILEMQVAEETDLSPHETIFLDRAIPDAMAYYKFLDLKVDDALTGAMQLFHYKTAFILDRLPLVNDYARREDEEEQIRIHQLIIEAYQNLPTKIIYAPVLPIEERTDFVLNHIQSKD